MACPGRWISTDAVDLRCGADRPAAMFARWPADCVRRHEAGGIMETLAGCSRRRRACARYGRERQPDRCQLVLGGCHADVWGLQPRCEWIEHSTPRFEDWQSD